MRGHLLVPLMLLLAAAFSPVAWAKPGHGKEGARLAAADAAEGDATLVVVLNATGGDATFAFEAEADGLPGSFTLATANGSASATFAGLEADDDAELALVPPTHWRVVAARCSAGTPEALVLVGNATTTCWFDAQRLASLVVHVNATGNGTFAFLGVGAALPSSFLVPVVDGSGSLTCTDLLPGANYSVAEGANAGWTLVSSSCGAAIVLAPGETRACWSEFDGETRLEVIVRTLGKDGTFTLRGAGDGVPAWHNVTTKNGTARVSWPVDADEDLSVQLVVPEGWELAEGACADVRAPAAGAATCTFTLVRRGAIHVHVVSLGGDGVFTLRFAENGTTTAYGIATEGGVAWRNVTLLDADAAFGVRLVVGDDWRVSRAQCSEVDLAPGETRVCQIVVTRLGEVQGRVVNVSTSGGLAGHVVYVDLDGDGERDAREPSDASGADGRYRIDGIPVGEGLLLRVDIEESPCTLVRPASGARVIDVAAGALLTSQDFRVACPAGGGDDEDDDNGGEADDREERARGGGPGYWKNWRNHHTAAQVTAWVTAADGAAGWSMPDGYAPTADGLRMMIVDSEGHCMKDLGKTECNKLRADVREMIARLNALVR